MSDGPADSFAGAVSELFADRIKHFAEWVEMEWKLTVEDAERDNLDMTPEQVEGWNKCCETMLGAASIWLEEFD